MCMEFSHKLSDVLDAPTNSGTKLGHLVGQSFLRTCASAIQVTMLHQNVVQHLDDNIACCNLPQSGSVQQTSISQRDRVCSTEVRKKELHSQSNEGCGTR